MEFYPLRIKFRLQNNLSKFRFYNLCLYFCVLILSRTHINRYSRTLKPELFFLKIIKTRTKIKKFKNFNRTETEKMILVPSPEICIYNVEYKRLVLGLKMSIVKLKVNNILKDRLSSFCKVFSNKQLKLLSNDNI